MVHEADDALPRLALVYGGSSGDHSPLRFREAAESVCSLIWVIPPGGPEVDRATLRFLLRLGEVVDVSELPSAEAVDAIRSVAPDAITCLIDKHLPWTAEIGRQLDLAFYSPATAERLTDKLAQRAALRAHGLATPAFWDVDDLVDEAGIRAVVEHGFPLVLKPRRGTSSQDTERIDDEDQLRRGVAASVPNRMLVEAYIPDPTSPITGGGGAPYVSVEMLVTGGTPMVLGITGRTPLASPFRETGFFFPADVGADLAVELEAVAVAAVRALGVETGALHVELKCTDEGPAVIEVNGRPGGHAVHPLLRRAAGIDSVQLALRAAVGERVDVEIAAPRGVAFRFDVQPDADIRRITAVEGLDAVGRIPGVEQVVPGLPPGAAFSWRDGTLGYAAAVLGVAPDHSAAYRIRDQVLDLVVISGTP